MKKIFALYVLLLTSFFASIKSTRGSISQYKGPLKKTHLDKLPSSQSTPIEGVDRLRGSERWQNMLRQEKNKKMTLAKKREAAHVEQLRLENESLLRQLRQLEASQKR